MIENLESLVHLAEVSSEIDIAAGIGYVLIAMGISAILAGVKEGYRRIKENKDKTTKQKPSQHNQQPYSNPQ